MQLDLEIGQLQPLPHRQADRLLVIDEQNLRLCTHSRSPVAASGDGAGSHRVNTAPPCDALSAASVPPKSRTMPCEIARPRPRISEEHTSELKSLLRNPNAILA